MNLQLRHILPYFEHDLKVSVRSRQDKKETIGQVCEISNKSNHGDWVIVKFDWVIDKISNNHEKHQSNFHHYFFGEDIIKPLLHPLSSITKLGVYNGEECVPLMELSKIAFKSSPSHEIRIDLNAVHLGVGYYFKYNEIDQSFEVMKGYDGKRWDYQCYVPKQAELFAAMSKMMIDVFDLIGQGYALDINTVEK